MGQGSTTPLKLDLWEGMSNIIAEKSIIHRLYGENVKIFKSENNENEKYALITQTYSDDHNYERQKKQAEDLKQLSHQNIVKIVNFSSYQKSEFCSSFWELKFLFEFLDHDLEKDMKQRIKYYNKQYEENELIHIFQSVVSSLSYMQSRGITHGDICPSNILIDFEGKVKLMPNKIIATQNNLMYMLGIDAYRCYLSPKQLEIMKTQDKNIQHNIIKSDLFSLGVILMEAALLQNMDELYYKKMYELNEFKIQLNLKKVKEKYSEQLSDFILLLLTQDENERLDAEQCFQIIEDSHLKGLSVANKLYSMDEVMKDPINLLLAPSKSNLLDDSKKHINDIQPITHSNLNELKLIESNSDPNQNKLNDYPLVMDQKEENKSDQEYIPPQNRISPEQSQQLAEIEAQNIEKQPVTLSDLRANLKQITPTTQLQNNKQYFQQQYDSRPQQQQILNDDVNYQNYNSQGQYNQQRQIYNQ